MQDINLVPDEKNERLMLVGKVPDAWKTAEEQKEEAWAFLRIKMAKEQLAENYALCETKRIQQVRSAHLYLQTAIQDLKCLHHRQYARLVIENNLKLMAAVTQSMDKAYIARLQAIGTLLEEYINAPQKISSELSRGNRDTSKTR